MPALPPNTPASRSTVLITGSTGFIGQWVLWSLLERGFNARVVVRAEEKGRRLERAVRESFKQSGEVGLGEERMECVVVEDFKKEGVFHRAVVGADAIVHVATAFPALNEAPEDTIRFGPDAASSLLNSALKYGDKLKRILVTSSMMTIWTDQPEPRTFTEDDRNEAVMREYEEGKRGVVTTYCASKIFAERAFQEFVERYEGQIGWDVAFVNPPYVYGPNLVPVASSAELTSTQMFWTISILLGADPPVRPMMKNGFIDVRDLGEVHVRCLESEEAGGERILACAGSYVWSEWYDLVRSIAPSILKEEEAEVLLKRLPAPTAFETQAHEYKVNLNTSKAQRILGTMRYRTKEELVRGILEKGAKEGWLVLSDSQLDELRETVGPVVRFYSE